MNHEITLTDYTVAPAKTFELPPDSMRKNLDLGTYVKLTFNHPECQMGERMWVLVEEITGPGEYKGTLNNDPVVVPMQDGDEVKFKWNNVIGILTA